MSETTISNERDQQTGRFLTGNNGGGRKPGARNRLGEEFIAQFAADVAEHGASVIERVRNEKPEVYLRVWADLLPRKTELEVDVNILADVTSTLEAFRTLTALVGADPAAGMRKLRQLAPQLEYEPR